MAVEAVRQGDTGVTIEKTVKENGVAVDISGYTTTKDIVVTDFGGVRTVHTGSFKTDGTDGVLQATSVAATWTNVGSAHEQVQLEKPTGEKLATSATVRPVHAKL